MKINIKKTAPKWHWRYNFLIGALFMMIGIQAQNLTKTFTKEVAVSDLTTIVSKGPRSMSFKMNGRISTSVGGGKYVITPGANDDVAALTIDRYQVFTWDKKAIKQVVDISIVADEDAPKEAQALMDNLKISLQVDANNTISIDDNMNIASFGFVNGWFSGNESFIILNNGNKYRIKSINIKSSLHIPKRSNFMLTSKYIPVTIGDLEGKMNLHITSSELSVGNVEQLEATILYSMANFNSITQAKINGVNSTIKTGCIGKLAVGSYYLLPENSTDDDLINSSDKYSYATTYQIESVENLTVSKTTFDKFFLGQVGTLISIHSTFSNYTIDELTNQLFLNAKNGDLHIETIAKTFESIELDNNISSIYLGMSASPDYRLKLFPNEYTEYDLPSKLSPLSGIGSWDKAYYKGEQDKGGVIEIRCHNCKVVVKD